MADKDMESGWDDLKRLAEQFEVKAHLATMEAKTLWAEELEPALRRLEQKLDKATEDLHVGEEMAKLEQRIRDLVEDLAGK